MEQFGAYVSELQDLLSKAVKGRGELATLRPRIQASLDGEAAAELRRLVPTQRLRDSGAFFTGSRLATLAVSGIADTLTDQSVIVDPACGAGDLLLACAARLKPRSTVRSTARAWGRQLLGRDVVPEFVAAARLRLCLLGLSRAASPGRAPWRGEPLTDSFGEINVGCGKSDTNLVAKASHILLNPPFTIVQAPASCEWGGGGVNHAAVFLEECVAAARPGTRIIAILPDVLRSGERYHKWRRLIARRALVTGASVFGVFDSSTDVDVFVLQLEVRKDVPTAYSEDWTSCKSLGTRRLGDEFDVAVGPVVDYRSPLRGPSVPYAQTCDLPTWGEVDFVRPTRRFEGTLFPGPFLTARRNSRPSDRYRIVPTLVTDSRSIAVENHLLVLRPKDGSLSSCRLLKKLLRDEGLSAWMNQRLRLRHLTVAAVRELPLP